MNLYLEGQAEEFADNLPEKVRSKLNLKLELYKRYGFSSLLRLGYLKKFSGDLYEIIVLHDYRFLGTIIDGNVHLVVGFRKKSQKTPRKLIRYAQDKISELKIQRHGIRRTS